MAWHDVEVEAPLLDHPEWFELVGTVTPLASFDDGANDPSAVHLRWTLRDRYGTPRDTAVHAYSTRGRPSALASDENGDLLVATAGDEGVTVERIVFAGTRIRIDDARLGPPDVAWRETLYADPKGENGTIHAIVPMTTGCDRYLLWRRDPVSVGVLDAAIGSYRVAALPDPTRPHLVGASLGADARIDDTGRAVYTLHSGVGSFVHEPRWKANEVVTAELFDLDQDGTIDAVHMNDDSFPLSSLSIRLDH